MTAAKNVDKTATSRAVKTSTTLARKPASPGATPAAATLQTVGILGLGIMGSAMAGNLMKAGFTVCGFDPSAPARKAFKAAGGTLCADAAALAQQVHVVITSLPSAAALIDSAHALASTATKGLLVVETSTLDGADKEAARRILAAKGVVLLDCPLSGTGAQAARKDLTVYASGPKAAIQQLQPVFEGFSKSQFNLGAFGNGMRMKLMANLLVAIHNVSTAEALLLGKRWGIRPADAVKVLADGAGGSRMLQVRGPMMDDAGWDTVTMKIEVWQKDMKLIAAALRETGVPAPLFSATVPIYDAAVGMGHAQHDTAAVFDVLDRMSTPASIPKPTKRAKVQKPRPMNPTDRLPPLDTALWTDAQRDSANEIIAGPRKGLIAPFVPLLRSPELCTHAQRMGEYLRYRSAIGLRLSELAILVTARHWDQQVEWAIHAPIAVREGVAADIVQAIADGRTPAFTQPDEQVVYELSIQSLQERRVHDDTWATACALLGEHGVVDLTGIVGYYSMLSIVMNGAQTPPPATNPQRLPSRH